VIRISAQRAVCAQPAKAKPSLADRNSENSAAVPSFFLFLFQLARGNWAPVGAHFRLIDCKMDRPPAEPVAVGSPLSRVEMQTAPVMSC
jgi:hypothetical protein